MYKRQIKKLYSFLNDKKRSILIASVLISPALVDAVIFVNIKSLMIFIVWTIFLVALIDKIKIYLLTPLISISTAYSLFIISTHRTIGYKSVVAVLETNFHESVGFLNTKIFLILIWLLIVLSIMTIIYFLPPPKQDFAHKKSVAIIGAISCTTLFFYSGRSFPNCFIYDIISYNAFTKKMSRYPNIKFTPTNTPQPLGTYIIVIGEATRRDCFYQISNANIKYNGVSTTNSTFPSVLNMLSLSDVANFDSIPDTPNIINMAHSIGYKTSLITDRHNVNLFSYFIDDVVSEKKAVKNDAEVVNKIQIKDKELIICHIQGCHIEFRNNIPKRFRKGHGYKETYYDAIAYNNYIIDSIIQKINSSNIPVCMFYVSDHGESLNDKHDNNYGHGERELNKYELDIPFVITYNKAFATIRGKEVNNLQKHAYKEVSHDSISHILSGLMHIKHKYYNPHKDLSSDQFQDYEIYVLDDNMIIHKYKDIK